MRFGLLFVAAALAAGLAALRAGPLAAGEDEKPAAAKTVKALRYRVKIVESALDWSHGGGVECDELWFPSRRVVANVTTEYGVDAAGGFATRAVLHAFFGDARTKQSELRSAEVKDVPTEDVEVPAELAERIFELAELTAKQAAMGYELAEKAVAAKTFRLDEPAPAPKPTPK
jgi:hypothetical protein